jgi:hypothetical protein
MKVQKLLAAVCLFVFTVSLTTGFAAPQQDLSQAPVMYVRGLAMLQLEDRENLRIALPDAPRHDATITLIMNDGKKRVLPFEGHGALEVADPSNAAPPIVKVSEVVRMKEFYGSKIESLLDRAPNTISIPWSGVRRVATEKVSDARYTFIRKDTGKEVETFRPRQIAESVRIELSSSGTLNFGGSKAKLNLEGVKAVWIEYLPQDMTRGNPYAEHFHHYLHYVDRPSGYRFDVEPKRLTGRESVKPRVGNSFWIDLFVLCYVVAVD